VHPVKTWTEFLNVVDKLAKGKHSFKRSPWTPPTRSRMCFEHAISELNRKGTTLSHPADWEYGKGWDAVASSGGASRAVLQLGYGVTFTSHAKAEEIERPVGKVTRYSPSLSGSALRVLNRFVEFVFYLEVVNIRRQGRPGPALPEVPAARRGPDASSARCPTPSSSSPPTRQWPPAASSGRRWPRPRASRSPNEWR
jgi:hypothetical protein